MTEPIIVTLDFTGAHTWSEIHRRIREAFDFPDWCGENWSAVWDMLNHEPHDPMIVEVRGLHDLPQEPLINGKPPIPDTILDILEANKQDWAAYEAETGDASSRFDYRVID